VPPGGPYRPAWSSSWDEEELWLRLDWALEEALGDPGLAWSMSWSIAMDSADFPDVRRCAEALMSELARCESEGSLLILEAAGGGLEEKP
jgi:hypothetical protein